MTRADTAPLHRLLRSELSCLLSRPRTLVLLGVLALLPVAIGIGVASAGAPSGTLGDPGPGLIAAVTANGLMLPIVSLAVALTLLLPLAVCVAAADALAGEASSGTLRMLLLAPVGRLRLVAVKALGVLALAIIGVLLIAAVGWLAGTLVVGDEGRLLTLSGSAIDAGDVWGRVWLAVGWTVLQLAAVGAIALAVSALTDRPLVVIATVLGGAIVFGVLLAIPSLGWLHPLLLTSAWPSLADLLRDPIPTENLTHGAFVAVYYLVLGLAVAVTGTLRREV
ncbi:ABC transporter permease [Pseudonocardia spinosispora]|uniref:ABC transporter permease n=1 Tax=Pseudonocardia spinosispora TaxID=103441 RepID=UPI00041BE4CA|nr:ABC transporter permease subunit [Pseudonocardia spinosispora]